MHTTFFIKVYVVQTSINFIFYLTFIRGFGLNLIHGKLKLHNDARWCKTKKQG